MPSTAVVDNNNNNDGPDEVDNELEPDVVEDYDTIKVDAGYNTRSWGFTIWPGKTNPVPPHLRIPELQAFCDRGRPAVKFSNANLEYGELCGTAHLQGCIIFKCPVSFERLRKALPFLHNLNPRHPQSTDYRLAKYNAKGDQPKKEWRKFHDLGPNYGRNLGLNREDGQSYTFEFGEFPKVAAPGKRQDAVKVKRILDEGGTSADIAKDDETHAYWVRNHKAIEKYEEMIAPKYEHHDTKGVWIVGKAGVGKSKAMRHVFGGVETLYPKDFDKWFDDYKGQEAILIDDMSGGLHIHKLQELLKKWSDRYPIRVQTKGGHVWLNHRVLMVTSQYTPKELLVKSYLQQHPFYEDRYKSGKRAEWRDKHPPTLENPYPPPMPPIIVPDPPVDTEFLEAITRRFPIVHVDMDNEPEVIDTLQKIKAYHYCSAEEAKFHMEESEKRRIEYKRRRRQLLDHGYRQCDIATIMALHDKKDRSDDIDVIEACEDAIDKYPRTGTYKPPDMPRVPHLITKENINDPPSPPPSPKRRRLTISPIRTTHQEYVQNRLDELERMRTSSPVV